MRNIVEKLLEVSEKVKNRPALTIGSGRHIETISYSDLLRQVATRAEALRQDGIMPGDRVLLFAPFSIALFEYMLALFWRGATAVFVDNWSDRKRLGAAVRVTRPAAFAGSGKAQLLRFLSREVRLIPKKLLIHGLGNRKIRNQAGNSTPSKIQPDHPALITLTTGSTGAPKAAQRTHEFLLAQHEILCRHLGTESSEVAWTTLPVFVLHFLGAGCTCILPEKAGGDPDKLDGAQALAQICEEHVTTVITSPSVLGMLAEAIVTSKQSTQLSKIFVGGAPIFRNDAEKYARAFPSAKITILYGSTEAEPIAGIDLRKFMTLDSLTDGLLVGPPIEEIRVMIKPVERDDSSTGEICVTGRHVLKSYYNSPEEFANNKFVEGGEVWHRTGDAGYIDPNGDLILMGRVGHRFEHGGHTYYPIAVEKKLRTVPGVEAGTVIQSANRFVAFIEVERFMDLEQGTNTIVSGVHEAVPFLDQVRILERLPRDPRHRSKIDYERLTSLLHTES